MDSAEIIFEPPRRLGLASILAGTLVFLGLGLFGFWRAAHATIGPVFLFYLLPVLLAALAVPTLAYQFLALQRAAYLLERDGLRLFWGLRIEEIPMNTIEWVRPAGEIEFNLPLPWLRWPGVIRGLRRLPDGKPVEFMASQAHDLLVISTPERLFVVSPDNPADFLQVFSQLTELGSLAPFPANSIYPTFVLARFWSDRLARYLFIGGLGIALVLLVWVSLVIPGRDPLHFGFHADGSPGDLVPAVQLLLLPVMNLAFFLADFLLGLFFYRRYPGAADTSRQPLAYLLWSSSVLTGLLFLSAVAVILHTS
jgi:hypothetical protein